MTEYALVTGAASGMGRQYALKLHGMGFGIVAVDRDAEGLGHLAEETGAAPALIPVVQDLSEEGAAESVREAFRKAAGPDAVLRILVNNAGMLFTSKIADTPPERLRAMMMVHCVTPLLLCREFIPEMEASGGGYILNISSVCAWMDWPAIGMYGNTKRFVKGYSRSLRIETRGTGVSVTTAIFGAVDTPLFGFSERTRRILRRAGIMISPETAVRKALDAMLKKRARCFPGLVNRIMVPFLPLLGDALLEHLLRRYGKYL